MNKRLFPVITAVAATILLVCGSIASAGVTSDTIGIKFGVNFPIKDGSVMLPNEVAGVLGIETANWNNAFSLPFTTETNNLYDYAIIGTRNNRVRNQKGSAHVTISTLAWTEAGAWP